MARLVEIRANLGITVKNNDVFYKPEFGVTIQLDENDTPDKRKAIFKQAWKVVEEQVEAELNGLID